MKKWIALGIAAAAVLAAVFLVILPNARRSERYDRAAEALRARDYAQAAAEFNELRKKGYKDSARQWQIAQEGLAASLGAAGDWDGAMRAYIAVEDYSALRGGMVYPFIGQYADAAVQRALAMAREGKTDEAIASLDEVMNDPPKGFSIYTKQLKAGKAQVWMAADRFEEAEAAWLEATDQHMEYSDNKPYWGLYTDCLYRHAQAAAEQGDGETAERLMKSAAALYNEDNEYAALRPYILSRAQSLLSDGKLKEAASEIVRLEKKYEKTEEMSRELASLRLAAADAFTAARAWDDFYTGRLRDEFERMAADDPAMERAYYLTSTGRSALVDGEADFDSLFSARTGSGSPGCAEIYRDLYYADGDRTEQFAAARACAREMGLEAEFLSAGMDLSAGQGLAGYEDVPLRVETLALFPAREQPGKGGALAYGFFRESYGEISDFRASEPRPCYYMAVTTGSAKDSASLRHYGQKIMDALAAKGSPGVVYHGVGNPHTASILLVMSNDFERNKVFEMVPVTAEEAARPMGVSLQGRETENYTGYAETVHYQLWDTSSGTMIASGTVEASLWVFHGQLTTPRNSNRSFRIYCDDYALAMASDGAAELDALTRENAAAFCEKCCPEL